MSTSLNPENASIKDVRDFLVALCAQQLFFGRGPWFEPGLEVRNSKRDAVGLNGCQGAFELKRKFGVGHGSQQPDFIRCPEAEFRAGFEGRDFKGQALNSD